MPDRVVRAAEPTLHLSDRLKTARTDRHLSQAQAARELGIARSAYRLWEVSVALPEIRRWKPIAQWLGVTVTTLLIAEGLIEDDDALVVGSQPVLA